MWLGHSALCSAGPAVTRGTGRGHVLGVVLGWGSVVVLNIDLVIFLPIHIWKFL